VLQTLALIQRTADDPRAVVAMARRQERELRGWLYDGQQPAGVAPTPGPAAPATVTSALTEAAEEVEGQHGVRVELVTVGDCPLDDRLSAIVAAAREAMVNAAKWSGVTSVSVYGEVRDGDVSVFVRDWGEGFDLAGVAPDRHGIRDSITGRMNRHGGTSLVRTAPGEGTEVQLRMPRAGS
jgi:signal transduction histidine kinase